MPMLLLLLLLLVLLLRQQCPLKHYLWSIAEGYDQ